MSNDTGNRRFGYQPLQSSGSSQGEGAGFYNQMQGQQGDPYGAPPSFDDRFSTSTGRQKMSAYLKLPLALTAIVLTGGVIFAMIMMTAYSTSDDQMAVPIVKADAGDYKVKPTEIGGMDIPFDDSTVFDSMRQADSSAGGRIENLLEPASGDEGVSAGDERSISEMPDEVIDITDRLEKQAQGDVEQGDDIEQRAEALEQPQPIENRGVENLLSKVEPKQERVKPDASDTPQQNAEAMAPAPQPETPGEDLAKVETAAPAETSTPQAAEEAPVLKKIRPAGSSPETLAFVRSVLDQKDTKQAVGTANRTGVGTGADDAAAARSAGAIEPAAGAALGAASGIGGTHFVQLASVSSPSGAASEWPKLQAKYDLAGTSYRVEEANLGARGTFYRIQAGPFSEAKARSICDGIKAQNPGGCLVVRK